MTKIVCLSGKACSGKNTSANWLFGLKMVQLGVVEYFKINDKGQLVVPAVYENMEIREGIFDPTSQRPEVVSFLQDIWPYVKLYSFADALKEFCITVLGLTYEQCYGTNDDKNTLTNIKWEDVPGVVTDQTLYDNLNKVDKRYNIANQDKQIDNLLIYHEPGQMTGREVMQVFGSDVCRRMYGDCWANTTINQIKVEQPELAIITDGRFPNEVQSTHNAGGIVIRFLRNPLDQSHQSEVKLDNTDVAEFDFVLNNQNMTIAEQNKNVAQYLKSIGYIDFIEETPEVQS